MNNNNSFLSKIITKQIIIDDDYIRKNYDGHKWEIYGRYQGGYK